MSDGDDETPPEDEAAADGEPDTRPDPFEDPTVIAFSDRLEDAETGLDAAETEPDLDDVEATLDGIEADLEDADLPEPPETEDEDDDEEDVADPREEFEDQLSDLRGRLEEQRGPYAEDVIDDIETAKATVENTRWTEEGTGEVVAVVATFLDDLGDTLDTEVEAAGDSVDDQPASLEAAIDAVDAAELDPDDDAGTIETLLAVVEALSEGLADAEEWDDLETREQLLAEGFYDVLGHYKDFPVEWSALKAHEQQGNADMILLALESLGSDFMEEHCLEALERMGPQEAFEAMHQRAEKRDRPAIRILGKIGDEAAVETLLEYVDADSDPQLQKATFRALGEIGSEEATQALANKLVMDNDQVRPQAARALGLLGDTRAIEPLAETLAEDDSDTVRAAAGWALRQIGTETALREAAEYTDDRSFLVQYEAEAAAEALEVDAVEA